jgi:putative ABC transport system permease protein
MRLTKCFKHAFEMVLHSKLRSWLTIVGIVIGVGAVIAIMSLGNGLQQAVSSQLGGLGGDIVTLSSGFQRGGGFGGFGGGGDRGGGARATTTVVQLTTRDVQVVRGNPNVLYIDTQIRGSTNVTFLGRTGTISVTGVDPKNWAKITTVKMLSGRYLDAADQNVIVIQNGLASTFFSSPIGINQMITVNGNAFRVVGITTDQGTSIYMPINAAVQIIPQKSMGVYDSIIIKLADQNQLNDTMTQLTQSLRNSRHVTASAQDFSLNSAAQAAATRSQLLTSLNTFLLAIAAVSLLVGAIGIANTMFTSVLEKTKEIGIMKAIGARNPDILKIFLFNAALIGLVGGVLGIICGAALSGFLPALLGNSDPLTRGGTLVTMNSVLLALSVSVIAGVAAGAIPAYRASKLKPVDALRYE